MSKLNAKFARARKAWAAAVLAAGPLTLAALQDSSPGGSTLTKAEVIAVGVTALVAFAGVYNLGNDVAPPAP